MDTNPSPKPRTHPAVDERALAAAKLEAEADAELSAIIDDSIAKAAQPRGSKMMAPKRDSEEIDPEIKARISAALEATFEAKSAERRAAKREATELGALAAKLERLEANTATVKAELDTLIVAAYASGRSYRAIAAETGLTFQGVAYICKRAENLGLSG